jgi:hypothetical protein
MSRPDTTILVIRLVAILSVIIIVPLLWQIMKWLPWQADCAIALTAALAFAYRFERESER